MTAKPARRPPPRLTASYIENAALHYLERFASSSANLRRVLLRKADRSLAHWGGEREEAVALVDALIARFSAQGYLDDAQYAAMKARSLNRRGDSTRGIRTRLAAKGVDEDTAAAAIGALGEEMAEPDLAAALRLACRRRLGPFRPEETRAAARDKDLATLARAGFPWDIVRRVVDAASVAELEEEALG